MPELETVKPITSGQYFAQSCIEQSKDSLGKVTRSTGESAYAAYYGDLTNIGGAGISGRPGMTFSDYYKFRPDEKPPTDPKHIIQGADLAYKEIDIVRNTIDLMADFVVQGISIGHPIPSVQKFGQNWFSNVVNGEEVSERFANYALRLGNVISRRYYGKARVKDVKNLYKAAANKDYKDIDTIKALKNEIPTKYTFIDPCIVDVVGGPLSSLSSNKKYGIKIPYQIADVINNPQTDAQKEIVAGLPSDIKEAAKKPGEYYVLPSDKIEVFHYKKDDWETWANPIIGSIMRPLITLEKLNLADMSALDGAISKVRIFRVGSLEPMIAPNPDIVAMLNEALQNNTGGGSMDMVLPADVDIIETKTDTKDFLGEEKYRATWMRIYAGLGIPPTLTGTFGASGTTNNFISLKTMITRLSYCRRMLIRFWRKELAILQKAMGFAKPFKVEFDIVDFGDEAAFRALLIQMVDRDLISAEKLQTLFSLDTELEDSRLKRENRERNSGKRGRKPNPLRDTDAELRKTALQIGAATPGQIGLELEPKKPGEKTILEMKNTGMTPKSSKPKGISGQGRPKNSKDSGPRKPKSFTPKVKAAVESWAASAQVQINDVLMPVILEHLDKKNARCLSNTESDMAELLKYGVLSNLEPFSDLSDHNHIFAALNKAVSQDAITVYNELLASTKEISGKDKLSMAELRQLQLISYTEFKGADSGQD